MGTILREPLLHFIVIGGLLFVAFGILNPEPAQTPDRIVVSAADIEVLEQAYQASWRRPPNEAEREAIIDAFVRQEILVREAQALGLDRNDTVIRQRLQQKMDFLLSSGANASVPTDEDLQAFLSENADRYQMQAQVAFQQIYLGQTASEEVVAAALDELNSGTAPEEVGERTLLPENVQLSAASTINASFGSNLASALETQPLGEWSGPVQSGYGVHLVRVTDQVPPRLPPLADIRDKVEIEWREARAEELSEAIYEELRQQYSVDIETSDS